MKNVVKCYKDFFGYFNALKTHCDYRSGSDCILEFCERCAYISVVQKFVRQEIYFVNCPLCSSSSTALHSRLDRYVALNFQQALDVFWNFVKTVNFAEVQLCCLSTCSSTDHPSLPKTFGFSATSP